LDMRDSFHQIEVHPEYTKFFAFAIPDGQFEYTWLSFGYSESPAEFQKRIIQILQYTYLSSTYTSHTRE